MTNPNNRGNLQPGNPKPAFTLSNENPERYKKTPENIKWARNLLEESKDVPINHKEIREFCRRMDPTMPELKFYPDDTPEEVKTAIDNIISPAMQQKLLDDPMITALYTGKKRPSHPEASGLHHIKRMQEVILLMYKSGKLDDQAKAALIEAKVITIEEAAVLDKGLLTAEEAAAAIVAAFFHDWSKLAETDGRDVVDLENNYVPQKEDFKKVNPEDIVPGDEELEGIQKQMRALSYAMNERVKDPYFNDFDPLHAQQGAKIAKEFGITEEKVYLKFDLHDRFFRIIKEMKKIEEDLKIIAAAKGIQIREMFKNMVNGVIEMLHIDNAAQAKEIARNENDNDNLEPDDFDLLRKTYLAHLAGTFNVIPPRNRKLYLWFTLFDNAEKPVPNAKKGRTEVTIWGLNLFLQRGLVNQEEYEEWGQKYMIAKKLINYYDDKQMAQLPLAA